MPKVGQPILKPYWTTLDRTTIRLYLGDVIETLRRMPSKVVQCVCTSPPYWGLRDYETDKTKEIGSEPTPDEYVTKMVEVFREVRRVLRDDGTLWLNLGLSYASGGMSPNQSPLLQRVSACGTDDKERQDLKATDYVCPRPGGEHLSETRNRRDHSSHIDQQHHGFSSQPLQIDRGSGLEDYEREPLDALPLGEQESTKPESSLQPLGASYPVTKASAFQRERQIALSGGPLSERKTVYTNDTSRPPQTLAFRTKGKESFFSACNHSDCSGIGKCGLCWCSLSIPSLTFKSGDEINMPHLVAMALQADGWILRQTIVWQKPSPMPESVRNRCTKSHEYIFLLAKRMGYFYDAEAVKETSTDPESVKGRNPRNDDKFVRAGIKGGKSRYREGFSSIEVGRTYLTRNKRSVWRVSSYGYEGAHFAAFPPKLITPCILAGTSAYGACVRCGAPWCRVVERYRKPTRPARDSKVGRLCKSVQAVGGVGVTSILTGNRDPLRHVTVTTELGWEPTCECGTEKVRPCVVLDIFIGSGTTAAVCIDKGRRCWGIDLSEEYLRNNAIPRIEGELVSRPALAVLAGREAKEFMVDADDCRDGKVLL